MATNITTKNNVNLKKIFKIHPRSLYIKVYKDDKYLITITETGIIIKKKNNGEIAVNCNTINIPSKKKIATYLSFGGCIFTTSWLDALTRYGQYIRDSRSKINRFLRETNKFDNKLETSEKKSLEVIKKL